MTITVNTKPYSSYRALPDSNTMSGPAHTASVHDTIAFRRKFAVKTKDFAGVNRPGVKLVRTLTLADATKADALIDISGSIPVGAADADILSLLSDAAVVLGLTDAQDLFKKLDVNA
jgi:hypothetical protein